MIRINVLKNTNWSFWHRWLGLVTCVGILLWGISGLSHPIMTRLQPVPVQFMPPVQHLGLAGYLTPSKVLAIHSIKHVSRLSAIEFNGQTFFRVVEADAQTARYFSNINGIELQDGDRLYAEYLAIHYSGRNKQDITNSTFINQFSNEYPRVNRLLPVWRVEFAGKGHLRAFIDTDQARLATLSDDTRYLLTQIFRFGHNWSFLDAAPRLQLAVMTIVILAALTSAISGLVLFVKRRHRVVSLNQALRRWHRQIALAVAISTLLFAGSGCFHLIMNFQQARPEIPPLAPKLIDASQLSDKVWESISQQTVSKITLVSQYDFPLWMLHTNSAAPIVQVAVMAHEHHHAMHENPAPSTQIIDASVIDHAPPTMLEVAQIQAARYAKSPVNDIVNSETISQFGGEYGFVFKRLPVVKVQFKGTGNPRIYVEPETGALAAKVKDIDALEGWSFAYLHKWEFANYNKNFRDILVALFILGNLITAMLGIWLFSRKY